MQRLITGQNVENKCAECLGNCITHDLTDDEVTYIRPVRGEASRSVGTLAGEKVIRLRGLNKLGREERT